MKKQLLIVGVLLSFAGLQAVEGKIMQQGPNSTLKDLESELRHLEQQRNTLFVEMRIKELCSGSIAPGSDCYKLQDQSKKIEKLKKNIIELLR